MLLLNLVRPLLFQMGLLDYQFNCRMMFRNIKLCNLLGHIKMINFLNHIKMINTYMDLLKRMKILVSGSVMKGINYEKGNEVKYAMTGTMALLGYLEATWVLLHRQIVSAGMVGHHPCLLIARAVQLLTEVSGQ